MNKFLWALLALLAVGVGAYGLMLALGAATGGMTHMDHHDGLRRIAFYGHFIFGPLALIVGIMQFLPTAPAKRPGAHRFLGRAYVVCCLLAGLAGLWMAPFSMGGLMAQTGFGALAVLWLMTTTLGFQAARGRNFAAHRRWMIRSYALTYGAVTLRLQLGIAQGAMGYTFEESYPFIAWLAWVPNALWAEWYVRRPLKRPIPQATE